MIKVIQNDEMYEYYLQRIDDLVPNLFPPQSKKFPVL